VAREVLRRTDHALLVGDGARKFAVQCGFKEEDLMTAASREAWLAWKAQLSHKDGWISPDESATDFGTALWAGHHGNPTPGGPGAIAERAPSPGQGENYGRGVAPVVPFTFGTIHVSGLDEQHNLYSCTSTSGLSYKIPGRVGDSPIVGAGIYTDNSVGSAGATGRGESTLHNCAAYEVVRLMEEGHDPTQAAKRALLRMASREAIARGAGCSSMQRHDLRASQRWRARGRLYARGVPVHRAAGGPLRSTPRGIHIR
jgi:N4-(beta-N-acetylglucosaminyl)-L-asparaginase